MGEALSKERPCETDNRTIHNMRFEYGRSSTNPHLEVRTSLSTSDFNNINTAIEAKAGLILILDLRTDFGAEVGIS